MWAAFALVGFLLLMPIAGPIEPAQAHCDHPQHLLGIIDTCDLHEPLEDSVLAFNEAMDGQVAIILAKDKLFHPEVVTIRPGGTVVFMHADVHTNEDHDPKSSPTCGSQEADMDKCPPFPPDRIGRCFNVFKDTGNTLQRPGDGYELTFDYDPGQDTVYKSHGILTSTLGPGEWAEEFEECPDDTSSRTPERAVIPFHCALHGGFSTADRDMRGAIIIDHEWDSE